MWRNTLLLLPTAMDCGRISKRLSYENLLMKLKSTRTKIPLKHPWEAQPVKIVGDAAIATINVGEGRLIPMVIIDSSQRPDIEEMIRVHEYLQPGDVTTQWGNMANTSDSIALLLRFIRPAETFIVLNFDIVKQGVIVDQILSSNGLYLQAGHEGDRFGNTPGAKRILIEVPETGFSKDWDGLYTKCLIKDFRRMGLRKHQAIEAAKEAIGKMRKIGRTRPWGPRT